MGDLNRPFGIGDFTVTFFGAKKDNLGAKLLFLFWNETRKTIYLGLIVILASRYLHSHFVCSNLKRHIIYLHLNL